jgi:hypothetical protein
LSLVCVDVERKIVSGMSNETPASLVSSSDQELEACATQV